MDKITRWKKIVDTRYKVMWIRCFPNGKIYDKKDSTNFLMIIKPVNKLDWKLILPYGDAYYAGNTKKGALGRARDFMLNEFRGVII